MQTDQGAPDQHVGNTELAALLAVLPCTGQYTCAVRELLGSVLAVFDMIMKNSCDLHKTVVT